MGSVIGEFYGKEAVKNRVDWRELGCAGSGVGLPVLLRETPTELKFGMLAGGGWRKLRKNRG